MDSHSLESIFSAALEMKSAERTAYLVEACGEDGNFRAEVQRLLDAEPEVGNFLDQPVADPIKQDVGATIGPYKLLQQIGEGGFGVVYMAEQLEPMRRQVALKIIKPGMDTRDVIARFEAERQALALMDHPNIAHVFDAGQTENGRPYFVMELVIGVPITEFCDKHNLDTTWETDRVVWLRRPHGENLGRGQWDGDIDYSRRQGSGRW